MAAQGQCVITELPGATVAELEALAEALSKDHGMPNGIITQVAGKSADGIITVVTFWESAEASNQFLKDRLQPAMQQHGMKGKVSVLEVFRHYQRG